MESREKTKETGTEVEENRGPRFSPPSKNHDIRNGIAFWGIMLLAASGITWLAYKCDKYEKLRATQACMELRQKIDSLNLDPEEKELLCSAKALKLCAETCMEALTGTEQQPETKE